MATALGVMGLEPRVFWSMTLQELDAAIRGRIGGRPAAAAPSRLELQCLMQKFPDEGTMP